MRERLGLVAASTSAAAMLHRDDDDVLGDPPAVARCFAGNTREVHTARNSGAAKAMVESWKNVWISEMLSFYKC